MSPSHARTPTVAATFGDPIAQRRRGWKLVVMLLVGTCLFGLASNPAQAAPLWGPATPAIFEDGVQAPSSSAFGTFYGVSCATAGNCTAVGSFVNADGAVEAFAQTLTDGVWHAAVPAAFAVGVQHAQTYAILGAVSCTSPGYCTAVGSFKNAGGDTEAFAQTQTNGDWGEAVPVDFPNGRQNADPDASLTAISCSSAGSCTAVGQFRNAGGDYEAFAWTQIGGTWGEAAPTTFSVAHPQHADPNDKLLSVSCVSPGNCTAVGYYKLALRQTEAFSQTQTDGDWDPAVPVDFAANLVNYEQGGAEAASVSCAGVDVGNCTVVGFYKNDIGYPHGFMQTQTAGTWSRAVVPRFPGGDSPGGKLRSVSCWGIGECTAIGEAGHGFAVTQTGGAWREAVFATFADGVEHVNAYNEMTSVSCASAGNCAAVGTYRDVGRNTEPFAWTQTDGDWNEAVPSSFASGTHGLAPDDYFWSVSCATAGSCTAVGIFMNADDGYEAFSQTLSGGAVPANAGGADAPTITGEAIVGETLAAGHGTWSNPPASESGYGYLWQVSESGTGGWAAITGADPNLASFVVPAAYEGKYLRVQVIAYGAATSEPAYSAVTAQVTRRGAAESPRATPLLASASAGLQLFSPAPGITVGATRGAVTLAASVRASCRDLVRGANIWVRSTSRVMCVQRSLPEGLSLQHGRLVSATPGTYPVEVRIKRANGTTLTRTITVTVR